MAFFVQTVQGIYGEMFITQNFHNLIHIVADANFFTNKIPKFTVHSISAFLFENYLQSVKRKVRGHSRPLQQIGRQLSEEFALFSNTNVKILNNNEPQNVKYQKHHHDGLLLAFCGNPQNKSLKFPRFEITTSHPNNCCQLKIGNVIFVENCAYSTELHEQVIISHLLENPKPLYGPPLHIKSADLGIKKGTKLSSRQIWPVSHVVKKCTCIKDEGKYVIFPLLHVDEVHDQ